MLVQYLIFDGSFEGDWYILETCYNWKKAKGQPLLGYEGSKTP